MRTRAFRELTDREKFTLDTMIRCTDGSVSFALIGESTVVTLGGVSPSDGEDVLKRKMTTAVTATLASAPETGEVILSNHFGVLTVGRTAILSQAVLSMDELMEGKMKGWRRWALGIDIRRQYVKLELIAVAFAD